MPGLRLIVTVSLIIALATTAGCTTSTQPTPQPATSVSASESSNADLSTPILSSATSEPQDFSVTTMPGDPEGRTPAAGGPGRLSVVDKCLLVELDDIGIYVAVLPKGQWTADSGSVIVGNIRAPLNTTVGSTAEVAELFNVGRSTVYRAIEGQHREAHADLAIAQR